jgi:hypothetical protein
MMQFEDENEEMVKLLDTQSSVKATQTVKLINEFLGKHSSMISAE